MKRLRRIMIGVGLGCGLGLASTAAMAQAPASATVSFGEWNSSFSPVLDRFRGDPAAGAGNVHDVIPNLVTIKAGGSVNFIVSGAHTISIYDNGTKPSDIDLVSIEPPPAPQTAGGVLSDANRRIYRGPDFTGRRDGVEVVKFANPGTYLVICARKNHFVNDNMFGFVQVEPGPASPPSIALSFAGITQDRVGTDNLAGAGDGVLDVAFTATYTGTTPRTVIGLDLESTDGGVWDTDSANIFWTLGAASGPAAPLLNAANDSVNFAVQPGGSFTLFASEWTFGKPFPNGIFRSGNSFSLKVDFSDGSTAVQSVTIP